MTIWAVVPASGMGLRMGSDIPKQYLSIAGQTVLEHSLNRLLEIPAIERITVVTSQQDSLWETLALASHPRIVRQEGANLRYLSVQNGVKSLQSIAKAEDWVLVHDAARPCVRVADIKKLIAELANDEVGGLLGIPVSNTLKKLYGNKGHDDKGHDDRGHGDKDYDDNAKHKSVATVVETVNKKVNKKMDEKARQQNTVLETVDRCDLWQALTPQLFRFQVLLDALQQAGSNNAAVTDEASAVELMGHKPRLIEGATDNIKITQGADLELARHIMNSQATTL